MSGTQPFFPFLPAYSTWDDWLGNVAIYYNQELIPLVDEPNWKEAAKDIVELSTFASYPVPRPERYEDWQQWATDFTEQINGPSR
jgi:hypothetical protein